MSNNVPGGTKVLNPKVTKMFSSSSSSTSSSKGLFKIVWLYHFTQSSRILHWAMHQHFAFSQLWSLTKHLNQSLRNFGFIYNTIFSLVQLHTNHFAIKNVIISQDWWYCCVHQDRESQRWLSVWTEPGQLFFSQYCRRIRRKPVRTDLLFCDRWKTSAQACTCC